MRKSKANRVSIELQSENKKKEENRFDALH